MGWANILRALSPSAIGFRNPLAGREADTFLTAALDRLPAAAWCTDHDLRLTSFRGGALPKMYAEGGSFVGRPLHEMLGLGYITAMDAHHRARAGEPSEFELLWRGRLFNGYADPWPGRDGTCARAAARRR